MSKRPSLTRQVVEKLKSMECFGQSRYDAKQEARTDALAAGITGWSPIRTPGIFSIQTMHTYRKESIAFTDWAKSAHQCKWLDDTRQFIKEYLDHRQQLGHSAWSLQTARAALSKLFQDPSIVDQNPLPARRKQNITRSRGPKEMDSKCSEDRNRDLVDLCRASGLRRHEIAALKVGNVVQATDGKLSIWVEQGKGGRSRTVPVLASMQDRVREIVANRQPDELVIKKIPVRADIHGYRREYAAGLYQQISGKAYDPRDKDTDAMRLVSTTLGHNRLDVITRNYLG